MARIVRFNVLEESHSGDNSFLIHRPYVLGNPYTHIRNKSTRALVIVKDIEMAISLYDKYFDKMLEVDETFRVEFEKLYKAYQDYDVVYLGCYCKPGEPCHGDVISKKLQQRALKDTIKNYRNNKSTKTNRL